MPATIRGTWSQVKGHGFHPAWGERGQEWIADLRKWISRQDRVDVSLRDLGRLLRDEMARQGQLCEALDRAEHELLEALRAKKLTAYGRVNGNDRVPHQPIPFTVFMDERIHLTLFDTVEGANVEQSWTHVQFQTADVLAFLQERQSKSPETQEATPERLGAGLVEPKPKHPGGRPLKYDWNAFTRELLRLANTPDGLPDRPALMRLMMDWCSNTWGADNVPAESVVRERIANLLP